MRSPAHDQKTVRFADYVLNLQTAELRRNGTKILLQGQPFQILTTLLESPGELVTREELIKKLWPTGTFVDFDQSLNKAMARLREALRDDAENPRFVETVPRRGYRFIVSTDHVIAPPLRVGDQTATHKKLLGTFVFLLLLAGIVGSLFYFLASKPVPFQRTEIIRLTTNGKVITAAISPDGRYVAYATTENSDFVENPFVGKESLWVRQVGTGNDVQIVAPSQVHYGGLTFSRDGNALYVTESQSKNRSLGTLYRIPVLAGIKEKLVSDIAVGWWFFGKPVTLSPDGMRVAFLRDFKTTKETKLMAANEDGSGEKQLAARKWPNSFEGTVAWSPDGKTIAAAVDDTDAQGKYVSLIEVSAQGGTQRRLTSKRWAWIVDLAWAPDGRGLIVNTNDRDSGPVQIEYVSYSNGEVRRITGDPNYYHAVSVTEDFRVIATMQFEFSLDAWVAPMAALDSAKPITSHGRAEEPTWSPDGKIVHWNYNDGNIWLIESNGSNPRQLTSNSGFNATPRISPDGRYIVFYSDRTGSGQVWRMDFDGGNPKQLTHDEIHGIGGVIGGFSADGKWVVYGNEGAVKGIWKVTIEGGEPIRLNFADSSDLAVSPDGKRIAYSFKDPSANPPERFANPARGIAIMSSSGGPPTKIFQITNLTSFRWGADDGSLIYTKNDKGVDNFWIQPVAGEVPRQMTHFTSQTIESFDVSHDGKWVVMSRGPVRQDVVLIRDLR